MSFHIPEEESLDREGLACLQRRKLATMLAEILRSNAFYRRKLTGIRFDAAKNELASLPFTTREELQRDQLENPPYGTNLTYPLASYSRLHQTSGSAASPLRWLDRAEDWTWWKRCWGIIYRAAGVTTNDRIVFPFSFGPFIGFWAAFEAATAMSNLCLPAGGMSTKARLTYLLENDATVVCCTPTYALRMAEVAALANIDIAASHVRALIVAGEPGGSVPETRERIESAWGARVFDHAGMTEIGPHSLECVESPGGLHAMESEFIVEVIDPTSGRPARDGETGELLLTNLGRWGSPLIRYRTGDMVRPAHGRCPCGRAFARLEGGLLGRIDDMLVIRGNNVYPSAIEAIIRRFAEVAEYRVELDSHGVMNELQVVIEPAQGVDAAALSSAVADAIRDTLNFRPIVTAVGPGKLRRFEMKAQRFTRRR